MITVLGVLVIVLGVGLAGILKTLEECRRLLEKINQKLPERHLTSSEWPDENV